MKLKLSWVLPAIVLVAVLFSLPVGSGEGTSSENFGKHLQALTEVAPRLAGTQAEDLTVDYIENEFDSYGLSVRVDNFKLENAFVYREAQLATLSPERENLKFSLLIRSPSTGGVLTDNLVYFESFPENLPPLEENIVLVKKKNLNEIMEASPEAIIAYQENMPAWSNVWPSNLLDSPVFTISFKTAEDLIEFQKESRATVRVELESSIEDRISHNVVATLPGESSETIIVSARHDSVMTPGAVDDASGVSVMLEAAQELSDEELQRTVKFVSFGAEEYDLVGSRHYVEKIEGSKVSGVLNIDSICSGTPEGLRVGLEGGSGKDSTPWLGEYVRQVAENIGLEPSYGTLNEVGGYSDYLSFVEEGIPAAWIYWERSQKNKTPHLIHTLADNLNSVSENRLGQVSQLTIRSVRKLSEEDLEDWIWDYRFPKRFSVFTILTSLSIVVAMVGVGYSRYVQGKKQKRVIWKAIILVLIAIFVLYLVLISGLVQFF